MNNQFDELTKGLAQSVTRRGALKKFGVGLAGIALATLGLTPKAHAGRGGCNCNQPDYGCGHHPRNPDCYAICASRCGH